MRAKIAIAVSLFLCTVAYTQTLAKLYKTSNLGPNVVAVACFYPGEPTIDRHGSLIIVGCPVQK